MFSRLRTTLLPGWIGCAPSGAQSSLALVQRPADGPPVVRWLASADWTRPTETLRQLKRGRELHRHRRVALLQKADPDGKPCKANAEVDFQPGKGEARLLTWTKARGVRYTPEGHRPDRARVIWNGGRSRALHGGDADARKGGLTYE